MMRAAKIWAYPILLMLAAPVWAQSETEFAGRWEGALAGKLRLVVELTRASDGLWLGRLTSLDQGNASFPLDDIAVKDDTIAFQAREVRGSYRGKLDAAGSVLAGIWSQGMPQPLELRKAAPPSASPPQTAPTSWPFGTPLVAEVPMPPTAFSAGGKTHLAYEVHLTNFSSGTIDLKQLEVFDPSQPLLRLERSELIAALQPVGLRAAPGLTDLRNLAGGSRVVAFLWLTLDAGIAPPKSLRHRITTSGREFDAATVYVRTVKPPTLGPPLKGGPWLAGNGPDNAAGHRRALIPVDGHAFIAQRFAIDWLKIGKDGRTFTGNAQDNRSYHAYGSELLAVSDGEIVAIHDGIPENVPGPASRAVPITLETVGGNYVILDLGGSQYAVYGHVQPGSLRVKTGDRVKRGQVLALLGNSGNSTEPHLHFHVADGPAALTAEGLPYVHDSFELYDAAGKTAARRDELPLLNAVVAFR
jgi:hypothetical protein